MEEEKEEEEKKMKEEEKKKEKEEENWRYRNFNKRNETRGCRNGEFLD